MAGGVVHQTASWMDLDRGGDGEPSKALEVMKAMSKHFRM